MIDPTIRYFGRTVDPSLFYRGPLGWLLRVANWLRGHLERFIVLRIFRLELQRAGWSKAAIRDAVKAAKDDPLLNPFEQQDSARGVLKTLFRQLPDSHLPARHERYVEQRRTAPVNNLADSDAFKNTLAAAMATRQSRYRAARGVRLVLEGEDSDEAG